jgi:hypothetical protein
MVLLGIEPGPSMVGPDLNFTYSVIWSFELTGKCDGRWLLSGLGPSDFKADANSVSASCALNDRSDLLCRL